MSTGEYVLETKPEQPHREFSASDHDFAVEVVSTTSQFDGLEDEWRKLLEESGATIFQSFEWQRTWWKHFGENVPSLTLHIVTIRKAGRLIGVAPFFIESIRRLGVVHVNRLSFIASETTDYLDVIIAAGYETEGASLLASHLAKEEHRFDVLYLIDMPESSSFHSLLFEQLEKRRFSGSRFVNEHCPKTTLLSTWESTLESFPSSKRSSLKRSQKKIVADFDVQLQALGGPAQFERDFSEFVTLHQKRWNSIGQLGVFFDKRTETFHRQFAEISMQKGWLFLGFLTLDGRRVAANYGFVYRNRFFYYLSGIDMQDGFEKYSLGRVLHLFSIKEAIRQGVTVYDFMRGTERYKYDFNGVDTDNWTILAYPDSHRLTKAKSKVIFLADSLQRRMSKERFFWSQSLKEKKLFSREGVAFVAERIKTNIKDGLQKAKSPEKSLTVDKKSSEE